MWLYKALVWVVMAGCLITVIDTFNIPDLGIITARDKDGRIEGIIGSAQEFGAMLVFYLPAMVALWSTESGKRRMLVLAGIALTLLSLLLSGSRGAMVGLLLGCIGAAYYARRAVSSAMVARAFAIGFVIVLLAVLVLVATDYGDFLETRIGQGLDSGDAKTLSSGRTVFWADALGQMLGYPLAFLTGFGWETFYQTLGHHYATHSVYVDVLYNLGMIGVVLLLLPFWNSISIARRALGPAQGAVQPYLLAFIFGMSSLVVAMAFSDIELAATYSWALGGVSLRLAMIAISTAPAETPQADPLPVADGHQELLVRREASGIGNFDRTKPATRPTSLTPSR
jgi:hypothetical protein